MGSGDREHQAPGTAKVADHRASGREGPSKGLWSTTPSCPVLPSPPQQLSLAAQTARVPPGMGRSPLSPYPFPPDSCDALRIFEFGHSVPPSFPADSPSYQENVLSGSSTTPYMSRFLCHRRVTLLATCGRCHHLTRQRSAHAQVRASGASGGSTAGLDSTGHWPFVFFPQTSSC